MKNVTVGDRVGDLVTDQSSFSVSRTQLNILKSFNLNLIWIDATYVVMHQNQVWYTTNCTDREEALTETMRELQLRCYLPLPVNEIYAELILSIDTVKLLQSDITRYGALTAVHIQKAYALFNRLIFVACDTIQSPKLTIFDKHQSTYSLFWTRIMLRIHDDDVITAHYQDKTKIINDYDGLEDILERLK